MTTAEQVEANKELQRLEASDRATPPTEFAPMPDFEDGHSRPDPSLGPPAPRVTVNIIDEPSSDDHDSPSPAPTGRSKGDEQRDAIIGRFREKRARDEEEEAADLAECLFKF